MTAVTEICNFSYMVQLYYVPKHKTTFQCGWIIHIATRKQTTDKRYGHYQLVSHFITEAATCYMWRNQDSNKIWHKPFHSFWRKCKREGRMWMGNVIPASQNGMNYQPHKEYWLTVKCAEDAAWRTPRYRENEDTGSKLCLVYTDFNPHTSLSLSVTLKLSPNSHVVIASSVPTRICSHSRFPAGFAYETKMFRHNDSFWQNVVL